MAADRSLPAPAAGSLGAGVNTAAAASSMDAAGVRAAVGLASANLDTQLGAIDTVVDGIKAKTDTRVDSNLTQINGTTITGNGTSAPWGPA